MAPISSFGTIRFQGGTGSKIKQDYFSAASALFCETGSLVLWPQLRCTGRNKLIPVISMGF
ncbi:hypothetical protein CES86_5092 [Brucella lupini]|uniref:Uncharacterized protein n=1 Tax=Brucella lupini TaxID=255457 RepID=A0A256GCE9_9HYPH|nr:hypothetical protein CES86_5092 [Brucella lupini]